MPSVAEQIERSPETFGRARLLAKDFDGTVARTFEKSPGGVGVHEAHELTVETVFGVEALDYYLKSGGLRNRAPIEVVQDLAPDARGSDLDQLVQQFIDTKLDVLLGEIGTRFPDGSVWPRPTDGYLALCEILALARGEGVPIDDLILSSGHEPFIQKTYRAWGVDEPTYIVAEEATRQLALTLSLERVVKPSALLMDAAHNLWRQGYGLAPAAEWSPEERSRMLYVGDDPVKDGELATNSGVDFVLLDPLTSRETWQAIAERLGLDSITVKEVAADVS